MKNHHIVSLLCSGLLAALLASTAVQAAETTPAAQLQFWSAQAGAPGNAAKGQTFFNSKHGGEWSCASCHGTPPTAQGKHANTGKVIAPLAPAFNAKAFTDSAKVGWALITALIGGVIWLFTLGANAWKGLP